MTPDGQFVQGYTAVNAATGAIVTTGASRPTSRCRRACCVRRWRRRRCGTQTNLDATPPSAPRTRPPCRSTTRSASAHVATITYTKTAASAWSYEVTVPGAEATGTAGTTAGTVRLGPVGAVTFNGTGALTAPAADVSLAGPDDLDQRRRGERGHVGSHRRQRGAVAHRLRGRLGHLLDEPERLGGRPDRQHQHHRRRHDHGDLRRRPDASRWRSSRWPPSTTRRAS